MKFNVNVFDNSSRTYKSDLLSLNVIPVRYGALLSSRWVLVSNAENSTNFWPRTGHSLSRFTWRVVGLALTGALIPSNNRIVTLFEFLSKQSFSNASTVEAVPNLECFFSSFWVDCLSLGRHKPSQVIDPRVVHNYSQYSWVDTINVLWIDSLYQLNHLRISRKLCYQYTSKNILVVFPSIVINYFFFVWKNVTVSILLMLFIYDHVYTKS